MNIALYAAAAVIVAIGSLYFAYARLAPRRPWRRCVNVLRSLV